MSSDLASGNVRGDERGSVVMEDEENDDENLDLIEIIIEEPGVEEKIVLPGTPFPNVPVTPEPV